MPIYEFKCLKCEEFFELLVMGEDKKLEMACPKCSSENFERVLSSTSYSMPGGGASPDSQGPSTQTRKCSTGSCHTYEVPGPK
jgi:putative FmdB family regulatory protein